MDHQLTLLLLVFVPLLGSLFLPLIGRFSTQVRNGAALLLVLVALGAALKLLPVVLGAAPIAVDFDFGFGTHLLLADRLAVFMAIVSSLVGAIIVLFSFGYISHYSNQNEYYFMVVLFLGSMMGLVFSANLLVLYVFWELTAIASWRLIGFYREPNCVLKADKAFMVTFFGAVVMLLGFITVYAQTGSFDLQTIRVALDGQPLSNWAVLLILTGLLSKSATLPLQTWLPDAGVAPSPVTALLHAAVLVKIGVYVYARLMVVTFTVPPIWHTIVPALAAASAIIAAGAAMLETDLKRLIAFSTISQIGFIFLGLSICGNGEPAQQVALAGGLLYILMHGLAKGGLFLCAGIVEQNTHTKDVTKLGGLIKTMPVTAISFLICAFSVMGLPPLGGFFSKYQVIAGAAVSGHPWITAAFVAGAFMTVIYLMRVFTLVFMGASQTEPAREGSGTMVFSVALLAALSLVAGLWINPLTGLARAAVRQMVGGAP